MSNKPQRQNQKPEQQQPEPQAQDKLVATAQQWSGPLPPPGALQQFNDIIPNGADRIMAMVEAEQAHRHQEETRLYSATVRDTKRSHMLGAAISLAAVGAAAWTAYIGAHPAVSIALVSLPIVSIVQAMLNSKSTNTNA